MADTTATWRPVEDDVVRGRQRLGIADWRAGGTNWLGRLLELVRSEIAGR